MLPENPLWTDRPAISWKRDDKVETNNCYWNIEILDLFRPIVGQDIAEIDIDVDDTIDANYDSNSSIFSTSYETILLLAAGVVQQIREEYFGEATDAAIEINNDAKTDDESIVFAVTIPEGPMLPLSVLVVHALNVCLRKDNQRHHAVLVPMDLDEGKDRNLHILKDARPLFALSIPGSDSEKLLELIQVNNNRQDNGKNGIADDNLPLPATKVLDLVDFVRVARKKLSKLSSKIDFRLQSSSSPEETLGSSCYSQFIASATTTATSLQSLVSNLATEIGNLSSESSQHSSAKDHESSTNFSSSTGNKVSHIVYTSGTTGRPKGCVSSTRSLLSYISAKNMAHDIAETSIVLLASALSFDPCLSDILATFDAWATLAIAPRESLVSSLAIVLRELQVTHVLCTPTLWSLTLLNSDSKSHVLKESFPHLQRVALGGEPIPKSLVQVWARPSSTQDSENKDCRLLATYGATEACVYQTCGEVFSDASTEPGQFVGHVLRGTGFKICEEGIRGVNLVEVSSNGMPGEIVLFGDQIDACTRYLNRPELNEKFVAEEVTIASGNGEAKKTIRYHYRTGDRGCARPEDGGLVVLGRIVGEEGMIKINGVRVELGEIEAALLSDENNEGNDNGSSIVTDCLVQCVKDSDGQSAIHAYCVFRDVVWNELGMSMEEIRNQGIIINGGPLWALLRVKCSNRLRKACIPSAFVGIRQLPLSRTGKRDRSGLPKLEACSVLESFDELSTPLQDYGKSGDKLFETLVQYLNLQPCQQKMVTRSVSFAVLGGDSLSAVVVSRTLYAHYHQVQNSRHLGGEYGQLPEPFNTASLLRAKNLGEYVDLLDESIASNNLQAGAPKKPQASSSSPSVAAPTSEAPPPDRSEQSLLYDALLQATTLDQSFLATALLELGADPNHGHNHKNRIGNTSGRNQRRAVFKAAPLHLACLRGNAVLVKLLLKHKASYKSPNTNGLFPIHLTAGGLDDGIRGSTREEQDRRLDCVKCLLEAGCPLLMKDANKQSILHASARAGHVAILEHGIREHQSSNYTGPVPLQQFLEFQDKWFRSALHWAVLHGKVQAAKVLLEKGADPSPYKPRSSNNRRTSMMAETPLEICKRVHAGTQKGIELEGMLLQAIEAGIANPSIFVR